MSTAEKIRRPLWRSFTEKFLRQAAEHVRAGGHALLWRPGAGKKLVAWMLLPLDSEGEMPELTYWSMLALEKRSYEEVARGAAKGLALVRIPRDLEYAVEEWCERDAQWPGATRVIELDCVTCAACCTKNRVILYEEDFARWTNAGRDDLAGKAFTRNSKGVVVLRLAPDTKSCVHLRGKLCGIYEVRPDNCSMFPAGSEPCLTSRQEELGVVD